MTDWARHPGTCSFMILSPRRTAMTQSLLPRRDGLLETGDVGDLLVARSATTTSPALKPSRAAGRRVPDRQHHHAVRIVDAHLIGYARQNVRYAGAVRGCWPARLRTSSRPGFGAFLSARSIVTRLALADHVELHRAADAARREAILHAARVITSKPSTCMMTSPASSPASAAGPLSETRATTAPPRRSRLQVVGNLARNGFEIWRRATGARPFALRPAAST